MSRWLLAVVLATVAFAGCANAPDLKPAFCKGLTAAIERLEAELAEQNALFDTELRPLLAEAGAQSVMDDAKEVWDSISTEDKLKAALAVCVYLNENYCKPTQAALAPENEAGKGVLDVLRSFTQGRAS